MTQDRKKAPRRIGLAIHKHRKSLKLTLDELGRKVKVSKQTVWMWETSLRRPSTSSAKKLARLFEADVTAFI